MACATAIAASELRTLCKLPQATSEHWLLLATVCVVVLAAVTTLYMFDSRQLARPGLQPREEALDVLSR